MRPLPSIFKGILGAKSCCPKPWLTNPNAAEKKPKQEASKKAGMAKPNKGVTRKKKKEVAKNTPRSRKQSMGGAQV